MKKIIVISGYLAGGKSTMAVKLSEQFQIPCFIKDSFKLALCEHVELASREEKSRFSTVTFDGMMHVAEQLMKFGYPLILEGNFLPAGIKKTDEAGEIQALIYKYGYDCLNIQFVGDTESLHKRFTEREETEERGEANRLGSVITHEEFAVLCHNMDGFKLSGRSVSIDTTDFAKVELEKCVRMTGEFLEETQETDC